MAPGIRYKNAAVRVTLPCNIDWDAVFGKMLVFSLSCSEQSDSGVVHSHSGLTFDKPYARSTVLSRIQTRYPQLKGNEMLSVKAWDGELEYINYISKSLVLVLGKPLVGDELGQFKQIGSRIDVPDLAACKTAYYEKKRSLLKDKVERQKKAKQSNAVTHVLAQISANYTDPTLVSMKTIVEHHYDF